MSEYPKLKQISVLSDEDKANLDRLVAAARQAMALLKIGYGYHDLRVALIPYNSPQHEEESE